jgi:hypothetical protein
VEYLQQQAAIIKAENERIGELVVFGIDCIE